MANAEGEVTPIGRTAASLDFKPSDEESTLAELAARLDSLRGDLVQTARAVGVLARAPERRPELDEKLIRAAEGCRDFGEFGHVVARYLEGRARGASPDQSTYRELPASRPRSWGIVGLTWVHFAGIFVGAAVGVAGAFLHDPALSSFGSFIVGGLIGHAGQSRKGNDT